MIPRSVVAPLSLLALLLTSATASAAEVTYSFEGDNGSFAGTDGWKASYCSDPWTTALNGGVMSTTDDGCGVDDCSADNNCGNEFGAQAACQQSDPLDNHIQYGSDAWQDYIFSARFKNTDDDAVGFVFRYHNTANFYLLFFTRSMAPSTVGGCSITMLGSRVYRIHNWQPVQLAESAVTYTQGTEHSVRIEVDGNDFAIDFDANGDGQFGDDEALFTFSDSDGPSSGVVGFWTYENGAAVDNKCADGTCWFDDLSVDVNEVKYCQNGQLLTPSCDACCMWFAEQQYYACGNWQACEGCNDECSDGQGGCSSELTHSWVCSQGDDDDCLERFYTACDETGICDEATSQCFGDVCEPQCDDKECGGDGCGGSCGTCQAGQNCDGGLCVCVPNCAGKECGGNGCGGSCGSCGEGLTCTNNGACQCLPECNNMECGDNGCGGVCGACLVGEACIAGLCLCQPACDGLQCGPDLCGGTCGVCGADKVCAEGLCICVPACAGKVCGDDGCDGSCGTCDEDLFCEDGICKEGECVPQCAGKECGFDGCGGICGQCGAEEECVEELCEPVVCEPSCIDKICGPDGCGGTCGECDDGWYCNAGTCVEGECVPECTDKECGDDGCGTPCGTCEGELGCMNGLCACAPQCEDKDCGADGCGGVCGECDPGWYCKYGLCAESECHPSCAGIECGDDGCGGVCGTCEEGFECAPDGQCQEITECEPKAGLICTEDQLFWVDSCGETGEKLQDCKYGCSEGECAPEPEPDIEIPTEEDAIEEADGNSAASGETVSFDTGAKSGGCTSTDGKPTAAFLLLVMLLGIALLRRRNA